MPVTTIGTPEWRGSADAIARQIPQSEFSNIMSIGADVVPAQQPVQPHAMLNYDGSQPDLDYTHIYGWNRGAVPIEGLYTKDQYGREFRIENRALGAPYELPSYGPFRPHVVNAYLMDVTAPYQQMLAPMWRESDHLLANFMNQQMPRLMTTQRAAVRSGGATSRPAAPAQPAAQQPQQETPVIKGWHSPEEAFAWLRINPKVVVEDTDPSFIENGFLGGQYYIPTHTSGLLDPLPEVPDLFRTEDEDTARLTELPTIGELLRYKQPRNIVLEYNSTTPYEEQESPFREPRIKG